MVLHWERYRYTSFENGPGALKSSKSRMRRRKEILQTRSVCSSAAMMLSTPSVSTKSSKMSRSIAGQTSSMSLTGVLAVQWSCKFKRRGDSKITLRHRRHTWTSDCHESFVHAYFAHRNHTTDVHRHGSVNSLPVLEHNCQHRPETETEQLRSGNAEGSPITPRDFDQPRPTPAR